MKTKKDLKFDRPYSAMPLHQAFIMVPAGTPVLLEEGKYWISPAYFKKDPIIKHDAIHYGFRVKKEDIIE